MRLTIMITGVFLATALLLLPADRLTAQDVKVDYDQEFDFKTLKSFSIKIETSWGNPLGEKRVLQEFESALTQKGWTKVDDQAVADAVVLLHGATDKQKSLNTFYSGTGGWGYRGWGGGMATAHTTVSEYTVGTLVVDIFDAKSKQLVFRGIAQDELSDKPEKNVKKLEKASEKMFKKFPPEPKK